MWIAMSETFSELKRQLDEACAEFEKTGDETVQWRIGELCRTRRRRPRLSLTVDCGGGYADRRLVRGRLALA